MLAIFAVDAAASKAAKPEVHLLAADDALSKAAQIVLDSGEFKAECCETLLLHNPAGLRATRLLIVGLGKAAKVTPHEVRKGAGTAVRFAKPRGLREMVLAAPVADSLDPKLTVRALAKVRSSAISTPILTVPTAKTAACKRSRSSPGLRPSRRGGWIN